MVGHTPNPYSPEEVRRAFQQLRFVSVLKDGGVGEILVGAGTGVTPTWTTEVTTLTLLTVDNITVNGASITSDTGAISFDNENLTTTGTINGVNVTSGNDPGHTHSIYSLVDGTRPFTGTVGGITPVADADLATKGYVDDTVSAASVFAATCDSDMSTGQPIYMKATGNIDLAYAEGADVSNVVGLCNGDYSATDSADFIVEGILTLSDWTNVIGDTNLTPGATYFLDEAALSDPDYSNDGGTGDRTSIITSSTTMTLLSGNGGDITTLVDGITSGYGAPTNNPYIRFSAQSVSGKYVRWDFGSEHSKLITEAIWYQDSATGVGTWKWQGSDDASAWTDIGSSFALGTSATQTLTELSGNSIGYRYYQILGVSGVCGIPILEEIEFKIVEVSGSPYGLLTDTAPTTSGVYTVRVGKALSTTQLDVEISQPILLR